MHDLRKLIRADGTVVDLPGKLSIQQVCERIHADTLDTVILADPQYVMLVDDSFVFSDKPVNKIATDLYWEKCGGRVDWVIKGDVVVVPDYDYA